MTPVTINGQTNNFTGKGTVNPAKLVIPYKDRMDEEMRTAMLAIEQYVNNLLAPSSGAYASLTGPGETVTPGELDQAGPLVVTTGTPDSTHGEGFGVYTSSNVGIAFQSIGGTGGPATADFMFTPDLITIQTTEGGVNQGKLQLSDGFGPGVGVAHLSATGNTIVSAGTSGTGGTLTITADKLGFYYATPILQPTVTGSRSSSAAITSLLTSLANLGLIVDSTTP
jgi:hypothetical protein